MDTVFGPVFFQNEIIWKRTSGHSDARRYGRVHDVLLFYTLGTEAKWNVTYQPYEDDYVKQYYRYKDPDGRLWMSDNLSASGLQGGGYEYEWRGITRVWRVPKETMEQLDREGKIFYTKNGIARRKRYLDDSSGLKVQDIWTDTQALRSWHKERLGYPTQKPQALLERIIESSSNEGDVVLDPFCGCGTAVAAAENLKRRWIGIDVTHLAVALMKSRLRTAFDLHPGADYRVVGEPADVGSARALAEQDRYQFQYWAMSLLEALPREQDRRKGADRGIDGVVHFIDGPRRATRKAIVQVKSGSVSSPHIRDLKGTVEREKASLGLFITLEEPTGAMRTEAVSAGFYHSDVWQRDYPKIQVRTIADLLDGNTFDMPPHPSMYQPAQRVRRPQGRQSTLDDAV